MKPRIIEMRITLSASTNSLDLEEVQSIAEHIIDVLNGDEDLKSDINGIHYKVVKENG